MSCRVRRKPGEEELSRAFDFLRCISLTVPQPPRANPSQILFPLQVEVSAVSSRVAPYKQNRKDKNMRVNISLVVMFFALCATIWFAFYQPDWQKGDWWGLGLSAAVFFLAVLVWFFSDDDDVTRIH